MSQFRPEEITPKFLAAITDATHGVPFPEDAIAILDAAIEENLVMRVPAPERHPDVLEKALQAACSALRVARGVLRVPATSPDEFISEAARDLKNGVEPKSRSTLKYDRCVLQRRIRMQRRELRKLNKAIVELNYSRLWKSEQIRDLKKRVDSEKEAAGG